MRKQNKQFRYFLKKDQTGSTGKTYQVYHSHLAIEVNAILKWAKLEEPVCASMPLSLQRPMFTVGNQNGALGFKRATEDLRLIREAYLLERTDTRWRIVAKHGGSSKLAYLRLRLRIAEWSRELLMRRIRAEDLIKRFEKHWLKHGFPDGSVLKVRRMLAIKLVDYCI